MGRGWVLQTSTFSQKLIIRGSCWDLSTEQWLRMLLDVHRDSVLRTEASHNAGRQLTHFSIQISFTIRPERRFLFHSSELWRSHKDS